ncbi:5799_t:CDS:10, partial [Dentiscutata erythropus]
RFVLIANDEYLLINLESGEIERKDGYEASQDARFYDVYGVIGFLKLLTAIHLVLITDRKHIGQIQGKNVYIVKNVIILPLDFDRACRILERYSWPVDDDYQGSAVDDSGTTGTHQRYISNVIEETIVEPQTADLSSSPTLISPSIEVTPPTELQMKKQPLTAFVSKMKSAWTDFGRRRSPSLYSNGSDSEDYDKDTEWETITSVTETYVNMDSSEDLSKSPSTGKLSIATGLSNAAKRVTGVWDGFANDIGSPKTLKDPIDPNTLLNVKDPIEKRAMDARISKEILSLFRSDAFFYSYELDITTSLQQKYERGRLKDQPLWKQTNKKFWWNEHMLKSFIELELHAWILPIMQGYLQSEHCEIDSRVFDFTIISRRSRERSGLRYQRRGINEQGAVANYVETEQILSIKIDDSNHDVSFLQVRGSIPLFWSQSPYSLKPKPFLERSVTENAEAFAKHFDTLLNSYGRTSCINLVESIGREATVGSAYREAIQNLGHKDIEYIEFDFHKECRGMKYENISKLVSMLAKNFNSMGYFWQVGDNEVHCKQVGIFRTDKCCAAREVLNLQLLRLGVSEFIDGGISHYEEFENIFNDVWANNGDSISREYAGTSALKGKRNLQGVFNDASNSLARMFQNTFKDFFRQATIDYLLGNHSLDVFQELQQKFEASQPGDAERWAKVRANAIDISSSIVIDSSEEKITGWTFLSPNEPNTVRSKSYEEKVLLLTKKALYVCTFHYRLEKVVQFMRIGLGEIICIEKGEYILSTLYQSCVTPEDNYGFVIYYRASGESSRINSGSMRNNNNTSDPLNKTNDTGSGTNSRTNSKTNSLPMNFKSEYEDKKFIAFKAFRSNLVGEATKFDGGAGGKAINMNKGTDEDKTVEGVRERVTSKQVVNEVVDELVEACRNIGNAEDGFVVEKPIIGFAEANKSTGIMTRVGFKSTRAWLLWIFGRYSNLPDLALSVLAHESLAGTNKYPFQHFQD